MLLGNSKNLIQFTGVRSKRTPLYLPPSSLYPPSLPLILLFLSKQHETGAGKKNKLRQETHSYTPGSGSCHISGVSAQSLCQTGQSGTQFQTVVMWHDTEKSYIQRHCHTHVVKNTVMLFCKHIPLRCQLYIFKARSTVSFVKPQFH